MGQIERALRDAIKRSGFTGKDLAIKAKVDQSAVSRFLAGKTLTIATAEKLAKVLGLELK